MSAGLETELKLRADDAALRTLAVIPTLGPAALGPTSRIEELDEYLDTADGRLAAAGWACRLRSRGGRRTISLKGPAAHAPDDPVHRRPEVEGDAPAGGAARPAEWPPSAARDLVLRLAGDDPLVERLALRQERTERPVAVAGRIVGTLSLDRVHVELGGSPEGSPADSPGAFDVVELEAGPGIDARQLDEVFDALRSIPGLIPDPLSKLERALLLGRGAAGAPR